MKTRSFSTGRSLVLIGMMFLMTGVSTILSQESRMPCGPDPERFEGARGEKMRGLGHGYANKEKAREMMMTLKIWKLTEVLNIDEKLSEKLYPRLRELENLRFKNMQDLENSNMELRRAIDAKEIDAKMLKKLVESANKIRLNQVTSEIRLIDQIFELLSTEQQARFLLVEADFHQNVRRFLRDQKRNFAENDDIPPEREMP